MTQASLDGYAIITGAASGIGKETAFALAEAGAKGVLFADIQGDKASAAAEDCKALAIAPDFKSISFTVDISDAQAVEEMVDHAKEQFGRIDYCVNAAGIDSPMVPFTDTPNDTFDQVHNVNVRGTFFVTKAVARVMAAQEPLTTTTKRFGPRTLSRGSIVIVASAIAFGAVPGKTSYCTSKHAVLGLARSSAMDLNSAGVRVNLVSPSWVNTPMLDTDRDRLPPGTIDGIIKQHIPLGRAAEPDEVAAAIVYLCGPGSTYVTGANIMIDNGLTLGPK
ncbi:hypothetical protein BDV95DRAFT_579890 [Massariosphaeria phaeospora]|uniref:NAD(P)-binding protein n=1 Tax=Massariosphaeria phaeospora TaxID=100035 RepID=A0A7C8I1N3_9PLEO|nr:hypothetical protein BDV95DRAFT_579890 [Massariosphaeria phaeospora]